MQLHKIMVTGGRDYKDRAVVDKALNMYYHDVCKQGPTLLIHGDAFGADHLAKKWQYSHAKVFEAPVNVNSDHWRALGPKAGPIRNPLMISMQPDILIAFPGGKGTANATKLARAAGIPVWEPVKQEQWGEHELL